jgi:hypothetical protein
MGRFMSDLTTRMRGVYRGTRCVGFVLSHARGFEGFDRDNRSVGSFEKARDAISAVLESTGASNWGTRQ